MTKEQRTLEIIDRLKKEYPDAQCTLDYKEAWKSYLALCRLSASKFYPEMLRECSLKVPFEDGYFEELVEKLEKKLHA